MQRGFALPQDGGGDQLERGVLRARNLHFAGERGAALDDDHLFGHWESPLHERRQSAALQTARYFPKKEKEVEPLNVNLLQKS